MQQVSAIVKDLRIGDVLRLDDGRIVITLEKKSGQIARLKIVAAESVKIDFPRRKVPQ